MTSRAAASAGEVPGALRGSIHPATPPFASLDNAIWHDARSLDEFISSATKHRELWHTTRRLASVDETAISATAALQRPVRLLVILEDWCGDAIHTVPVVARLAEHHPRCALRVVQRDQQHALMQAHLTGTARAIPVVIAYDEHGNERGWWGPRPSALQAWVRAEGLLMESAERYRAIRTWYARDRGVSTAAEVLALLQYADGASRPESGLARE